MLALLPACTTQGHVSGNEGGQPQHLCLQLQPPLKCRACSRETRHQNQCAYARTSTNMNDSKPTYRPKVTVAYVPAESHLLKDVLGGMHWLWHAGHWLCHAADQAEVWLAACSLYPTCIAAAQQKLLCGRHNLAALACDCQG